MNFINNFVCFETQEIDVTKDTNIVEVTSPYVVIKSIDGTIKGFKTGFSDKAFMVFIINDTNLPLVLVNNAVGVTPIEQFNVSTNADKTIPPNSYEVLVYANSKWYVRDFVIPTI